MVWAVYPTLVERRRRASGPPAGVRERRRYVEDRLRVRAPLVSGWLTFESRGERRRLAPIPDGWEGAPLELLRAWLASAEPAPPPRRLIE